MTPPWILHFLQVCVFICFIHLGLVTASFLGLLILGVMENGARRREDSSEDYEAIAESRFTIPVSVVCPAYNEEAMVVHTVRSVLASQYPEFEVILVNDGSRDATLEVLRREFKLERREVFYRRVLSSTAPTAVYRSRSEPRLTVIDKPNGGKADALNCGINFARFRYVCCVDGDTVFHKEALLRGMRLILRDPARVLGATSHVAISNTPEANLTEEEERPVVPDLLNNYQHIDYLRSFMNSRLGWSRLNFMLCSVGAFAIWRRDTLVELGGFSGNFTCEDIEMTFRVHHRELREKRDYSILSLSDTVGHTEGPERVVHLVSQRARWQRVIMETVWHYRGMFMNPRYGTVGMLGVPFYVLAEVVAPLFELLAILTAIAAMVLGVYSWRQMFLFLGFISFLNASFSTASLLLKDLSSSEYRLRDLVRLALIGPLELVLYRPWLTYARLLGTLGFLRGDKSWNKFARNTRSAAESQREP